MSATETSDLDLAQRVRAGDDHAVAELYLRHHAAMLAYARSLCRDEQTAEDLAGEAFARTLRAVQAGGGPEGAWRPYLYAAVRNLAIDWARSQRHIVLVEEVDDGPDPLAVGLDERAAEGAERALIAAAFGALPRRQQTVLWHAVVEEEPRERVAAVLGTSPGNVNVMVFRAREGLREAYLALHASTGCAEYAEQLAHMVRRPRARRSRRLREHLDRCAGCGTALAELTDMNRRLRAALLPAVLLPAVVGKYGLGVGAGVGAGVEAAGSVGRIGLWQRVTDLPAAGVAAAGASALALAVAPIVIDLQDPEPPTVRPRPTAAAPAPAGARPVPTVPSRATPTTARATAPRPDRTPAPADPRSTPRETASPRRAGPSAPSVPPSQRRAIEDGRAMIVAANRERAGHGLPLLQADDRLDRAAAIQALQTAGQRADSADEQWLRRHGHQGIAGSFRSSGYDPARVATSWFGEEAPTGGAARSPSVRAIGAACARGSGGQVSCALLVGWS
ncbi:sigma-70 family RNA polymerase sigma factor [Thermomonospora umbrina]|uniref:RNA polymerase sigma factor (Sigma-70 family) n=1 Tax=Thermomonospora umbrina TaxID=111806 RepID=A0A3D9SH49_9ACTN|nr:sigma-70 family RNA polymerase sigma factor [Thermomonospora umbrina]REE95017.1 RNA polymerase sigma factor (sigma-70 family) [Thermomonospora umbrina]